MSLVSNILGAHIKALAVLCCDICEVDANESLASEIGLWRANYLRAALDMALDFDGHEAFAASSGWAVTFESTVDALLCARALSSLGNWQAGGPGLSGGLAAGEVTMGSFAIGGGAVEEAINLCRRALPWQILVADPIKLVVSEASARTLAPADMTLLDSGPAPGWAPPGSGGRGERRTPSLRLVPRLDETVDEDATAGPKAPAAPPAVPTATATATATAGPAPAPARAPATIAAAPGPGPEATSRARTGEVRLNILGWVELEGDDPTTRWPVLRGTQARAVLSMLALRRGPVHREELAEMLWPEDLPAHWEGALRGLITKVRRFLDAGGLVSKEVLVGEGGYYELRLPPTATLDRDLATALIADAAGSLAAGRPRDAVASARDAADILKRQLLSGLDNAWFDQARAELVHDRLTALELSARADLAAGGNELAKRASVEALTLDPYRESSYRLLMQAHSAAGSRAEALRTYERCRRMLADELGVGPAPQTQALYIHLLG